MIEPWYLNFLNNMATVQFGHRLLAWLLACSVPALWFAHRRLEGARAARIAADALFFALALQIALGIATLVLHVPIALAAAHQAGAVVVFAAALALAHVLRK
jgi:cytochrome c oxidase assembly protein subunit 15